MSTDIPPKENDLKENLDNIAENTEEKKINNDNPENQISPDFLNLYTNFYLSPLEQILINKLMPYGFKLETEENLLKKDEKKKKGYLHRKHKKFGNSNILENIVDNENNIDMNTDNNNNDINNNII